jgi:pyruvate/2-oxoglutarate dehydrogenase complex dihydrolipoamide acyltransferase (E2) component
MGTFGVSVYSALGAESLHPLSPLTTAFNYGVIQPDGHVDVRIIYDHRVIDGATVARALLDLEKVLNQDILRELQPSKGLDHRDLADAS